MLAIPIFQSQGLDSILAKNRQRRPYQFSNLDNLSNRQVEKQIRVRTIGKTHRDRHLRKSWHYLASHEFLGCRTTLCRNRATECQIVPVAILVCVRKYTSRPDSSTFRQKYL